MNNKLKIRAWLNEMGIENYTIEDNLIVNVTGHVMLQKKNLSEIPIQFGIASGNFSCNENQLVSLEGSPHFVGGYFSCNENNLINLTNAPQVVEKIFFV